MLENELTDFSVKCTKYANYAGVIVEFLSSYSKEVL